MTEWTCRSCQPLIGGGHGSQGLCPEHTALLLGDLARNRQVTDSQAREYRHRIGHLEGVVARQRETLDLARGRYAERHGRV